MAPKRKRADRDEPREEPMQTPPPRHRDSASATNQSPHGSSRRGRGGGRRQSRQNVASPAQNPDVATTADHGGVAFPTPTAQAPQLSLRGASNADSPRPATPAPNPSAAPETAADSASKPLPAPYYYEHLAEEVLGSWQESGKQMIMEAMKNGDEFVNGCIMQELVRGALDGKVKAAETGSIVGEAMAHHAENSAFDAQSLFLSTLSLLDDTDTKNANLLSCVAATNLDPQIIRQELDIPLLQSLSLVRNTFDRIRTRKTTNMLYRQANFNLLREETEGYAKLLTDFHNTTWAAGKDLTGVKVSAPDAFQRVMALVGAFDLDVGRVLDILLDIGANLLVLAYKFCIKFYRSSSWWPDSGVVDSIKWEDQGFGSLPQWALPGYDDSMTDQEREAQSRNWLSDRESRDSAFWDQVREDGVDAFFKLGARKIVDFEAALPILETEMPPQHDARNNEVNADRRKRINENREYMRKTGTLPPPGNSDAAQLLGFKLRFYNSDARDHTDIMAENLVHFAALLIKIGFISLRDLYPHLHPADDDMGAVKDALMKEKAEKEAKEKRGAGGNPLAMAGALTDDTLPTGRNLRTDKIRSGANTPKVESKEGETADSSKGPIKPPPPNQKVILLKALLAVGAVPEALYILGRFPWLVEVDVTLPPFLNRIVKQMLRKITKSLQPLCNRDGVRKMQQQKYQADGSSPPKVEKKSPLKWLGLETVDEKTGDKFSHYYREWEDNIPICQTVEHVFTLCNTFVGFVGFKIGQDVQVLSTLLRLAKREVIRDASESNRTRWLKLMKRLIIPSLSVSKHNPGLAQEAWELLKLFPTAARYNIYAEWFDGKTRRDPDIAVAHERSKAEVKDVFQRLSNETQKKSARLLAKVSFASPAIVMERIIALSKEFVNMIPSLVEVTRYFTPMDYDVLVWSLLKTLSDKERPRIQEDAVSPQTWIQFFTMFVASLYSRFEAISLVPILHYLGFEIRNGASTDILLLGNLCNEMTGIRADVDFSEAQVLGMAGGEHMQFRMLSQLGDKRFERKKDARRFLHALEATGLTAQALIAMAQDRRMHAYRDSSKNVPLKVLAENQDKISRIFIQYLEVLKVNMAFAEFEAAIPDVCTLIGDFGLEPGPAFTIARVVILARISEHDTVQKQVSDGRKRTSRNGKARTSGDVEMQDSEGKTAGSQGQVNAVENGTAEDAETKHDVEMKGATDDSRSLSTSQAATKQPLESAPGPWHPILEPIIRRLPELLPNLEKRISVPFFATFWTLSLQDIMVSTVSYDMELASLRREAKELNDRSGDALRLSNRERDQRNRAVSKSQERLHEELKVAIVFYQGKRNRLSRSEKNHWFPRLEREDIDSRHLGLLQECFLPRAMLSSLDSHFSYVMLKIMHEIGTPGFSTMHLLNQLLRKQSLAALMFQCTENEAQNLGRFLNEVLGLLKTWHVDKATYEKEALGPNRKLFGFAKTLDSNGDPEVVLEFEEFRRLLFNWHSYINGALQLCFDSGEYMHIRNGISVLRAILSSFPAINFMGQQMTKQVGKLADSDGREDLTVAATSLQAALSHTSKQWMMPQAFRLNEASKDMGKSGSRATSARPETPGVSGETRKLNATAADIKPVGPDAASGTWIKESVAGREDGEVDDEKQGAAVNGDTDMKDAPESQTGDSQGNPEDKAASLSDPSPSEREQPKSTAKPSTPAPVPAKPPSQESGNRPSSAAPRHNLPNRPDLSRQPSKNLPGPPRDRSSGRNSARADDKYGRLDRTNEAQPVSREHSPSGRRRGREAERDPYYGGARLPRDDRPPHWPSDARHQRDEAWGPRQDPGPPSSFHTRQPFDGRERVNGTTTPRPREAMHPDRAGHFGRDTPNIAVQPSPRPANGPPAGGENAHGVNPDRLALIHDDQKKKEGTATPKDSRNAETGQSGRGRVPFEPQRGPPTPSDGPGEVAPTGPRRTGRLGNRDPALQGQQESSYGRLNAPAADVPSGPRPTNGPSTRGSRNFTAPQVQPTADSPSSFRNQTPRQMNDRRNSGPQFERAPSSTAVPTTTAEADSGPTVHPSRMNQVGPPPIQTSVAASDQRAGPSPTTGPPSGPRGVRTPLGPPTGPGPANNRAPPSGPSANDGFQRQRNNINATLSQGSGNGQGQGVSFRGAAGAQNGRQSGPPATSSAALSQAVQSVASPMEPPTRRAAEPPTRADFTPSRPDSRSDLFQSRQEEPDTRAPSRNTRRLDDERAPRPSRHEPRDHRAAAENEQFRRSGPPPQPMDDPRADYRTAGHRDDRRPRDARDMRGGAPPVRDTRGGMRGDDMGGPPRRMPAEAPGPPFLGPGAQEWERGSERRGPPRREGVDDGRRGGRGGRPDEFGAGRGGPPRREDDGRGGGVGSGPPPPMVRKRRHEDAQGPGAGPPQGPGPAGFEKRHRSGR